MAGRKMGESECFATAARLKEGPSFSQKIYGPASTDPSSEVTSTSAGAGLGHPAGLAGGRLFTYANFPPQKFSLNAKFLTDGPLIFSAPLSQNAAAPRNKKCVFETRM